MNPIKPNPQFLDKDVVKDAAPLEVRGSLADKVEVYHDTTRRIVVLEEFPNQEPGFGPDMTEVL